MDLKIAQEFFEHFLIDKEKHHITIRTLRDRDKTGDPKQDATSGKCGTFAEILSHLKKANEVPWGAYFVVNHTGGKGTLDADVKHARALFIDIDGEHCPEFFPVAPSAILRRSDGCGFHVYWFLSEVEKDLARWTAAQKSLISFYKSDKTIHNPARLMRIPGTVNHKKDANGAVYEIQSINKTRYTVSEVLAGHESDSAKLECVRKKISNVFSGMELSDGDGRHQAFVQVSFILHDYGFTGDAAREELARANEKYLRSTYTPEELQKFLDSQKYAKNEKGGAVAAKVIATQEKVDRIRELTKDWYYVRQQDAFFMEGSQMPVTGTGFNAKFAYASDCANPVRFCFLHDVLKQYESLVYEPAEGPDVPTVGGIARNTYLAPDLEPVEKKPTWFLKHIEYLIPEKTEREHFLDYFAYLIQHPGKKINHGVLVIGKQGVGKSILQRVFAQIFGESNVSAPHNENLSGSFTGWAKHCRLVVINELMQVDKKDFNNKIKPFITERTVEIREMYKAPYQIENHMHFLAFSNHDNALYLDREDRRWLVVKCPHEKKDAAYYDALVDNIDNRCGEVLHFLQSRDVSAFRPGAAPPMTEAKQVIVDYSKSDLEVWIEEGIESESSPFDTDYVTVADIRDALPIGQRNFATHNRITKILRSFGAVSKERIRVGGELKRFWIIRNHEKYEQKENFVKAVLEQIGEEKDEKFLVQ